ncbi:DUF6603 domain-containing protein [Streptomyces formicae]|uniref:DUF6603 domain-containing protein n=1 Tax=Streptomyces formicae TaxID=1616117 RepID=A0ABY3WRJ4_9ACTN|nr:DUF6603 domain-containing protein [Streptomyces formicae]UNM13175.1 hypothetical protein J4032_18240 [Streptomyces formicae]
MDLIYASDIVDQDAARSCNELLGPNWVPQVPSGGLKKGAALHFDLSLLGKSFPVPETLDLGSDGSGSSGGAQNYELAPSVGEPVVWWEARKNLGPVALERIGFRYRDKTVWVLLDVVVSVSGSLRLATRGLGVAVPLSGGAYPLPQLEGLELGFKASPVEVAAALVRVSPPDGYSFALGGAATVAVKAFQIQAVGFYAHPTAGNTPSLFVYGGAGSEKGVGNSIIKVKDARLGFGHNSSVRQPTIDDVDEFPFLALLKRDGKDPLEVLGDLVQPHGGRRGWVSTSAGSFWLAGGLGGTLFEYADWRAALVLEFGPEFKTFTANLVGKIDATFPKQGKPYARVILNTHAGYSSVTGLLQMTSVIKEGSFLISSDCKVGGGAALRIWTPPSPHTGDFVYTIGGYHPDYKPPAHYPSVEQRFSVNWTLVPGHVVLKGGGYFALTPDRLMLGGKFHLGVDYKVTAGVDASLDVLIGWHPFYFDVAFKVRAWVDIGRVSVGAYVKVWGPPTGGHVTIYMPSIIPDINFDFGSGRKAPPAVTWNSFMADALGCGKAADIITTRVLSGLLPEMKDGKAPPTGPWIVSGGDFSFLVRSVIPITRVTLIKGTSDQWFFSSERPLYVRPLPAAVRSFLGTQIATRDGHAVSSAFGIQITRDGQSIDLSAAGNWRIELVREKVPGALWGYPNVLDPSSAVSIPEHIVGISVTAPGNDRLSVTDIAPLGSTLVSAATKLAAFPIRSNDTASDPHPVVWVSGDPSVVEGIAQKISSGGVVESRGKLYSAIPASIRPPRSDSPLTGYAKWAEDYLSGDPMTAS